MPVFDILVTRDITESLPVKVEAVDEAAAREYIATATAEEIESLADDGITWEIDSDSRQSAEIYITSESESGHL